MHSHPSINTHKPQILRCCWTLEPGGAVACTIERSILTLCMSARPHCAAPGGAPGSDPFAALRQPAPQMANPAESESLNARVFPCSCALQQHLMHPHALHRLQPAILPPTLKGLCWPFHDARMCATPLRCARLPQLVTCYRSYAVPLRRNPLLPPGRSPAPVAGAADQGPGDGAAAAGGVRAHRGDKVTAGDPCRQPGAGRGVRGDVVADLQHRACGALSQQRRSGYGARGQGAPGGPCRTGERGTGSGMRCVWGAMVLTSSYAKRSLQGRGKGGEPGRAAE
eukprot:359328-Chlamydomonas_euryale.AAC.15